jgi:alkanesulfonate monooxygenase SsuD/methylene tetrahydromethanopterin reductase-like flavin-dependent oxidoreductase (luciferase family)
MSAELHLGTTPWRYDDLSAQGLGAQAQRAEALGYRSFWLPENHFNELALPDPLMLLAACSAVTEHIALGTTSYLLTIRNALQAAEQVAVLDQLSRGRVILGVGRGFAPAMLGAFKVSVKDKRRIFEDCLNEMLLAWSGASMKVSSADAPERVVGEVALGPRPVQAPHPPLWVAAFGPKALGQAGRLGLPYLASPMETLAELQDNLAVYEDAYAATWSQADQPPARQPVVPIMRNIFICDHAPTLARIRKDLEGARRRPNSDASVPADDWAVLGDAARVADELARYRETLGMTHLIASRPRVSGLSARVLDESMAALAELTG